MFEVQQRINDEWQTVDASDRIDEALELKRDLEAQNPNAQYRVWTDICPN